MKLHTVFLIIFLYSINSFGQSLNPNIRIYAKVLDEFLKDENRKRFKLNEYLSTEGLDENLIIPKLEDITDGDISVMANFYRPLLNIEVVDGKKKLISLDTVFYNLSIELAALKDESGRLTENIKTENLHFSIISKKDKEKIFSKGIEKGWRKFYRKFIRSGGLVTLSDIQYSNDKKFAALYMSLKKRGLNAAGYIILIDLVGEPKILKTMRVWIS